VSEKVCAVIVTYNRKDLLRECLNAVLSQTRPPDHVLVVDNASTDGTPEMLKAEFPQVEVLRLPENQGGAGGFHEGMKRAYEMGFEWLWIMDSDIEPTPQALEKLLEASEHLGNENPAILASRILWTDGSLHPMNYPWPRPFPLTQYLRYRAMGFPPIRWAAFTSILIASWAVQRYGFPCSEFFIRADDLEYTGRILRNEKGFWVLNSVAIHKTPTKYTPASAHPERFFYEVRNRFWAVRGPAYRPLEKGILLLHLLGSTLDFLWRTGWKKAWPIIQKGLRAGLTTSPDWEACQAFKGFKG